MSDVSIAGLASYPALMLAQLVNILESWAADVLERFLFEKYRAVLGIGFFFTTPINFGSCAIQM